MKYLLLKNKNTGIRAIFNKETQEYTLETADPVKYAELRKKALNAQYRATKNDFLKSLGLTKVKGSAGGTYWE